MTDLDEFDDMPIGAWWASKGETCTDCRVGHPRPVSTRGVVPPARLVRLLPRPGTRRREVYDLLLTCGGHGASIDDLTYALGRHGWALDAHLSALAQGGFVEWDDAALVWRVTNLGGK